MENTKSFGKRLRMLVKSRGYRSYEKAAEDFEISLSYLQQLMREERSPSREVLLKIGKKLNVTPNELFGIETPAIPQEQSKADSIIELMGILPTLQNDELESLLSTAKSFLALRATSENKRRI